MITTTSTSSFYCYPISSDYNNYNNFNVVISYDDIAKQIDKKIDEDIIKLKLTGKSANRKEQKIELFDPSNLIVYE